MPLPLLTPDWDLWDHIVYGSGPSGLDPGIGSRHNPVWGQYLSPMILPSYNVGIGIGILRFKSLLAVKFTG